MARLFLSAAQKSSGKTSISVGICAALRERSMTIQAFKKGPDYIDPIWLSAATGRPCRNLDFHTQSPSEIINMVASHGADFQLIEGNKGLHDGVSVDGSNASSALAKLLKTPVVLVLDTVGTTRGIAPLVLGYQAFDPDINIAGIILNKVGAARHEAKLRGALETYTDIPVLGAIPRSSKLVIEERHLGLVPANEDTRAHPLIKRLREAVADGVDLERLLEIARPLPKRPQSPRPPKKTAHTVRIGIARDRAFCFYYQDDLDAMDAAGAELIPFDTMADTCLPSGLDGLFLGGGFPETHLRELSANSSLRGDIRQAGRDGLPIYAECGGLMYLSRRLTWHGEAHDMVGLIPGDTVMHKKPQGRGYVTLKETGAAPWRILTDGGDIAAHEFHYSTLENIDGDPIYAFDVLRGRGITGFKDGILVGNTLATYAHLRTTAGLPWAARFTAFVRQCKNQSY